MKPWRNRTRSFKMILLVIGAQGVADPEPQSWIASLHDKYADTPLVLVSEREEAEEVVAAFKAGARGFIPMSVTPPVAMQAFTFIMSGGSFFPPTALIQTTHVETSVSVVAAKETAVAGDARGLTARQQEVLERLRQGESNKLIGRQLKLRESTVKGAYPADHEEIGRHKSHASRAQRRPPHPDDPRQE